MSRHSNPAHLLPLTPNYLDNGYHAMANSGLSSLQCDLEGALDLAFIARLPLHKCPFLTGRSSL